MGAFDVGLFDNDSAADWAHELEDAAPDQRAALLLRTLQEVLTDNDEDDVYGAEEALAAAAVVAAATPGGPAVDEHYGPAPAVVVSVGVDAGIRALALEVLQVVIAPGSEWHELWTEAGYLEEAMAALEPVQVALRA